mmetsp:Transcript_5873/g.8686  ORF Transcript_5873/g.8686 Transcript_5873/m.8686 type:complete len:161 (-) Transcript_5873:140-622(-)
MAEHKLANGSTPRLAAAREWILVEHGGGMIARPLSNLSMYVQEHDTTHSAQQDDSLAKGGARQGVGSWTREGMRECVRRSKGGRSDQPCADRCVCLVKSASSNLRSIDERMSLERTHQLCEQLTDFKSGATNPEPPGSRKQSKEEVSRLEPNAGLALRNR